MPLNGYTDNPVLCRAWRGQWVESQHRGAWVLVDAAGNVQDGAGDWDAPVFARSSIKSLQALPLLETGAAARHRLTDVEIALAVASHDAEPCHTEPVAALLARLGLGVADLLCGPQQPGNAEARRALRQRGLAPSALHNNCSGKHAGFLALARHLGTDLTRYLDPDDEPQRLVRAAVLETCDLEEDEAALAIDGCSAPTFRMPLRALATGLARVANPEHLSHARRDAFLRITAAAAANPVLVAGSEKRLCTDLLRASGGRLFPKIGAEAIYVVGVRDSDRGLAVKIDDGGPRALEAVVLRLLERLSLLGPAELRALESWRPGVIRNWAGVEVGRLEVLA